MSIGERASAYYIRHPPAGSFSLLDGRGIDAGTAMLLLDNNPAVLERELSLRTLVFSRGPNDALYMFDGNTDPTESLVDGGTVTDNFTQGYDAIAWDRRSAVRFGPFYGVADRDLASGRVSLRTVRMRSQYTVDASGNGGFQDALFAMTQSPDPQSLFLGTHLAHGIYTLPGVGKQTATADLSPAITTPGFVSDTIRCRRTAANHDQVTAIVYPFWLWFGHHFENGSGARNNYLDCMSAWEIR